jgi:hypothetical protein
MRRRGIVANKDRDCTRSSMGLAMAIRSGASVERWAKRNRLQQAAADNLRQQAGPATAT